ncbi:MAG: hypothetical protein ABSH48_19810 [Verrucomicrobiota bacterium]
MNTETPIPRKRSRIAQVLFTIACLATLVALFYAEEDWRGWHTWRQFKQQCEARGVTLDLASVVPPPVPDDQNFAMTPIAFTSYGNILTRDGKVIPSDKRDPNFVIRMRMRITGDKDAPKDCYGDRVRGIFTKLEGWQSYYRTLAGKKNEFPVPAQPQSPAGDVLLALSKYDSALDEVRAANQLPESRFPMNYDSESPWDIFLPHLAALKSCSQVLQLRSVAELQDGQAQKALDDVRLGLQLTDKVRTEPILISHLVRLAMLQIMLQPIWEGLAQHKWSEEQLASLEAQLATLDFFPGYRLSLHGELGGNTGGMDYVRRHPAKLEDMFGMGDLNGQKVKLLHPGPLAVHLIPNGWFYENEYRSARLVADYYLPAADPAGRTFSPGTFRRGQDLLAAETKTPDRYNWYETLLVPALGNCVRKFAYGQASADLARTAVALERYRLAHGELPESLDVLAPKYIAAVPHDVIGGGPLKYRREANGRFIIYSIGWNETDDGGTSVFKEGSTPPLDLDSGDWVWEYPPE